MEAIIKAITAFMLVSICPLSLLSFIFVSNCQRAARRRKHPVYFELCDRATKICFDASTMLKQETTRFEYQNELLMNGLVDGECTEEYFKEHLLANAIKHVEAIKRYREQQRAAERLVMEADEYAKSNNFKWGIMSS